MTLAFAGLLAGFVHVLSGPDHLAAIAPYAVDGKSRAWRTGVRWGLGHAAGVLGVGLLVLALREALPVEAVSAWGERLVGLALIGIGIWGICAALARATPALRSRNRTSTVMRHSRWVRCTASPAAPICSACCRRSPCRRISLRGRIFSSSVQAASPRWAHLHRSSAGLQAGRARAARARRAHSWVFLPWSPSPSAASGSSGAVIMPPAANPSERLRRHRDRRRTGRRARRDPCGGAGRAHGTRDRRGVRRDGRQRWTRAGAGLGLCRAADARRATAASVRHHHERTCVAVRPAAGARARSRARREHALGPAREDRCARRDGLRAGRRGPLHRPAHDRDRRRTSARSGEVHPLHRRREPTTRHSRHRAHPHAQRRLEVDRGAAVDAGHRRRGHGRADRFHVPCVRLEGSALRAGSAHSARGGRVGRRGRRGRSSRVGRGGARTIRRRSRRSRRRRPECA